mgnify:FL=1
MNPNTPVLVGVSQILQRFDDVSEAKEPLLLMLDAARGAVEDAEAADLMPQIDSVRVVRGRWRYKQPAG